MSAVIESLRNECWVVSTGLVGQENQCLGLAERLSLPIRRLRVALRQPWDFLAPLSFGAAFAHLRPESDRFEPPWPSVLIACGRRTIPISLAVKWASGGRTVTVQCEHPRVPVNWFDLVVAPVHDRLSGPNVVSILGSPNRITPTRLAAARSEFAQIFSSLRSPRIAVLIGGESRTHGTFGGQDRTLVSQLALLARDYGLMVSTSRRTPAALVTAVATALSGTDAYLWRGDEPNPYFGILAWADAFAVTGDSVNMICEAASTGKPVHVFAIPGGRRRSRIFHRLLRERGITRGFQGTIGQWEYSPLDETDRAAARIRELLGRSVDKEKSELRPNSAGIRAASAAPR